MKKLFILTASLLTLFMLTSSVTAATSAYVKDEVLVVFESAVTSDNHQIAQDLGIAWAEPITSSRSVYKLSLKNGESVKRALDRLNQNLLVKYAQPNFIYRAAGFTPDDPLYSYQWDFGQIKAESAWLHDQTEPLYGGDPAVTVAVLDTGVAFENYNEFYQAPDLAETSFTVGYDFVNDDEHPNDDNGHGTHMAGTIAESTNNGLSAAGLAFNTTIMPIKVLSSTGEGTSDDIIAGLQFALDHGADIINMSFGSAEDDDQAYSDILDTASEQGIILVAAAGNAGANPPQFPGRHEKVIGVGAVRYDGTLADYSNSGPGLDLVAPGGDLQADQNGDGSPDGILQQTLASLAGGPINFAEFDNLWVEGTSSATAHVSAASALLLAQGVSADSIQSLLESTAQDLGETGYDEVYGYGLINLETAFDLVAGDTIAPTTTVTADHRASRENNYYLTAPTLILTATDELSEITNTYYRWDNEDYVVYTQPISAPEGTHRLSYYSIDLAGNSESSQTTTYTVDTRRLVIGANFGGGPQVKVRSAAGFETASFFAYATNFRGGVSVALGEIDGDGQLEIITAPGPGGGPQIRIFSLAGTFKKDFFAYDTNLRSGVNLAVGNLDGGALDEIVTAPMAGGGPNIRIFGWRSSTIQPTTENFMAYDSNFRGGVSVAVADLEGNGQAEIITAPQSRGGPQIRIFGFRDKVFKPVILGLMAYDSNFRGGVTLAGGDIDGDGQDEIITGVFSQGGPHIKVFGRRADQTIGLENAGFMAFAPDFRGGVSLATSDYQADGKKEIVVGVRSNGSPLVRYYKRDGTILYQEYLAFAETFKNGINLSGN